MPQKLGEGWTAAEAEKIEQLTLRMAAADDFRSANLSRSNLAKPKTIWHSMQRLEGMVRGIEKVAAAKKDKLEPINTPRQYRALDEINLFSEENNFVPDCLPVEITVRMLDEINRVYREIGAKGYEEPHKVGRYRAPQETKEASGLFTFICASAIRFINQYHYLKTGSRKGGSRHNPMRFSRRIKMVEEALEQLAEACGAEGWTLQRFNIVTPEIRDLWGKREAAEPLPAFFARNLFEHTWPEPSKLDDATLDRHIQQHPDMDYVEKCRAEKTRRMVGQ